MKKSNRELNIFSMSTLDLFASAMGAFILITLVLFPYVLNTGDSEDQVADEQVAQVKAQLEEQLAQLKAQLEKQEAEIKAQLEERMAKAKAQVEEQVEEQQPPIPKTGDSEEELARIKVEFEEEIEVLQKKIEDLREEIDRTSILLGIRTKAEKFVFVLDMSGSMDNYRQAMILSVDALLAGFKTEIELAMIGFHTYTYTNLIRLHYWPANKTYFRVNQNTRNRVMSQTKNWMGQVGGGTPTLEALKGALALNPEEIILLTDGAPLGDWRSIVNTITSLNTQKIPIHVVAVGDYLAQGDFIKFLVELTKRNDGSLVGTKPG